MAPTFIILLFALVVSTNTINAQRCGRFATWSSCASRCPISCEGIRNPPPFLCAADCVTGCRCLPGYIRISGANPDCMREADCPYITENTTIPTEPIRDCMMNAVWSFCASACPETCETIRNPRPIHCTKQCHTRCRCLEGYVQRSKDRLECIKPEEC